MRLPISSLLACCLTALLAAAPCAAKDIKVKVRQPGTLAKQVGADKKLTATAVTIVGALNNDDLRFLREMCGRDAEGKATKGKVRTVNLHGVTFVPSGEPFFSLDGRGCSATSAHAIPRGLFYQCPLDSVVLPARTDSIGERAFYETLVRRVTLPDYVVMGTDAFYHDLGLTHLTIGACRKVNSEVIARAFGACHNLAHVEIGNVAFVGGITFPNWQGLETVRFTGRVGHIDGYAFQNNPRLRSVVFEGTVLDTGGEQVLINCPEVREMVFNGPVLSTLYGTTMNCPKFQGYRVNNVVYSSGSPAYIPPTAAAQYANSSEWTQILEDLIAFIEECSRGDMRFLHNRVNWIGEKGKEMAMRTGHNDYVKRIDACLRKLPKFGKAYYLQSLREAATYNNSDDVEGPAFDYAPPTDPQLTRTRLFFNLDSIAGKGSDIDRMKRLMRWLHDEIRHDGSSPWPDCPYTAVELYKVAKRDKRGLNSRFLAIMLHEMYLAVGIPARYLTCLPKDYDSDPDCHVLCVAWSESLGKWVWMDPTYEAYVTDENGLLLHPGEVRRRLVNNLPVFVNEGANWNNENRTVKEDYIDEYMCKNLYYISSALHFKAEPEKKGEEINEYVTLRAYPSDGYMGIQTANETYFWSAPNN